MKNNRIVIASIIIALLGLIFTGQLSAIKGAFDSVFLPIEKIIYTSSNNLSDFISSIKNIKFLSLQNSRLEKENVSLQAEIASLKEVSHENELLRNELGFLSTQSNFQLIPSQIISKNPSEYLQRFKINKGSKDGVKVENAVISNGYFVGRVTEVTNSTSEIELITDSRSLVPIILQDSRETGLLRGGLKGLVAEDISVNAEIKANETVLTSGLSGSFPAGIPIGTVNSEISSKSEIFKRISINSPIKLSKLEIVFVVKQ